MQSHLWNDGTDQLFVWPNYMYINISKFFDLPNEGFFLSIVESMPSKNCYIYYISLNFLHSSEVYAKN